MRKFWDRWGWLLAVAIVAVGFIRILWGREPFCGPVSEHCLREWVSALAGWAAVPAALMTIVYLSKQIGDAQRQHRLTTLVELRRAMALARRVQDDVRYASTALNLVRLVINYTGADIDAEHVDSLKRSLTGNFADFESEVGRPEKLNFSSIHNNLIYVINALKADEYSIFAPNPSDTLNEFEEYIKEIDNMAKRFIEDPVTFWEGRGAQL